MIWKLTKVAILIIFLNSFNSHAQTFKEWFRQKKTQKEYLLQQIAALWAYGSQLKEGYNLVKDKTGGISRFIGSEYDLHKDFFNRLKEVDPSLLKSGKVESILKLHSEMDKQRIYTWKTLSASTFITHNEKQQIKVLFDGLAGRSDSELHDMEIVLSSGLLELTDDERIKRIDKIYRNSQEIYKVHSHALPMLIDIIGERQKYNKEFELLRKMYGFQR